MRPGRRAGPGRGPRPRPGPPRWRSPPGRGHTLTPRPRGTNPTGVIPRRGRRAAPGRGPRRSHRQAAAFAPGRAHAATAGQSIDPSAPGPGNDPQDLDQAGTPSCPRSGARVSAETLPQRKGSRASTDRPRSAGVTVHESRVTSVQKRMEPRRSLLGASVDVTDARDRTHLTWPAYTLGRCLQTP